MRRTKQQQEHHPSFFKVLIGDFDKQLRIPASFVVSNVTRLPKSAVIETMISGNSRAHQAVTIEQVGKNHCFTTGWNELVKRFKLNAGDFAVFWLVSDTVFNAIFYGPNGCEKEISKARDDNYKANLSPKKEGKRAIPRRSMAKGSKRGYGACGKSFKVLMKKHRRYRLRLPLDFVTKSGIAGKKWVVLKNKKGEVWPVDLAVRRNGTDLTSGWANFRRANEIVEGRFCLFKFIEDNVILVKKL